MSLNYPPQATCHISCEVIQKTQEPSIPFRIKMNASELNNGVEQCLQHLPDDIRSKVLDVLCEERPQFVRIRSAIADAIFYVCVQVPSAGDPEVMDSVRKVGIGFTSSKSRICSKGFTE